MFRKNNLFLAPLHAKNISEFE